MHSDILIVGAGPTGLMLANQLARRGVRPLIIDRHSGPAQQTRAIVVQARTMEIYDKMALAAQALGLGRRATGANLWTDRRRMARIPIGDIGTGLSPFPFLLMLGQDDNERIMGEKLHDWDVAVQWNTELTALEQRPDCVRATLKQPDGTMRTTDAAYVAGCDGSHSAVRALSGITFPGAPYEEVFFVADTEAIGPMVASELNVFLSRGGFHLFFPMFGKDRWRVIGILPRELRERDDLTFEQVIPAVRTDVGTGLSFNDCSWFSTYRIHHRSAERFRDRRCFLLGDAAHIHSPVGAQGMNTGLQDAYNLAWKLTLVIKDEAGAALLDSYEAERMPVAERLLHTTDRAFQLVVSDSWIARLLRTKVIARLAAFAMTKRSVRTLAFRTVSQIGIHYRSSPLSKTLQGLPDGAPKAGDRFPWLHLKFDVDGPTEDVFRLLDDTRFNLLVVGQPLPPVDALDFRSAMRVYLIPSDHSNAKELARVGIAGPAFYLLRPDGHVALAGSQFDTVAVKHYLSNLGLFQAP